MRYEPAPLRAEAYMMLVRCHEHCEKHLQEMPASYRRQYAAAFFQGVAELFALKNERLEANDSIRLSFAIARFGFEPVWEAHERRLTQ